MPRTNKVHASEHAFQATSQSTGLSGQQRESWIHSALAAATRSLRENQKTSAGESHTSAADDQRTDDS